MAQFDNDFDKIFSKGFDKPLDVSPTETDWRSLEKKLGTSRPSKLPLYWMLPLLLLIPLIWLGIKVNSLEKKLSTVQNKTLQHDQSIIKHDTLYYTHVHYDTIFKTIIINSNIHNGYSNLSTNKVIELNNSQPLLSHFDNENHKVKTQNKFDEKIIIEKNISAPLAENNISPQNINKDSVQLSSIGDTDNKNELRSTKPVKPEIGNTTMPKSLVSEDLNNNPIRIDSASMIPIPNHDLTLQSDLQRQDGIKRTTNTAVKTDDISTIPKPAYAEDNKDKRDIFNRLGDLFTEKILEDEPAKLRLGLSMGYALPLGNSNLKVENSLHLNLNAELIMGSKWSLVPAVGYTAIGLKLENPFDNRIQLPAPVLPSTNFSFKYVEGNFNQIIPSLSLRYRIRSDADFSGYIGIGQAIKYTFSNSYEYEFGNSSLGEETHYTIEHTIPTKYSFARFHGGLVYNLSQNASLFTEIDTYLDYGKAPKHFNLIGGLVGFRYLIK